ncbi:hypothetical protein F5Y18DRAFT_406572 [Xylariaceae sp. FL1019]|nr:hypothetical protein F5Y18DRAFT_406572 [Xylariaceae sp. FL1019]
MDTGDYDTNALVFNNISSVSFALYEPAPSSASLFTSIASDVEASLRKDGHLVCLDANRRGFWLFSLLAKGQPSTDSCPAPKFERSIESTGCTLCVVDEGSFEPAALVKLRFNGPNAVNTPSSSSSSASSALDPFFRSAHSATVPSVPMPTAEHDTKALGLPDVKSSSIASTKVVYEHFLSAGYSTVSACFSSRTGAIPLSSRTLLLPKPNQRQCAACPPVLATIRIYLTTTGSLVLSLSHSLALNLINLSESVASQLPPFGFTVLAAPLGLFATCQSFALTDTTTTDGSRGQSPDTQVVRLRSERGDGPWKALCSKLLQSRMISLPMKRTQKWVGLQRIRRRLAEQCPDGKRTPMMGFSPNVFWPTGLLFCRALSNLSVSDDSDDLHLPQLVQNFDPLGNAKDWFLKAAERKKAMEQKDRQRGAAASQESMLAEGQVQSSQNLSPLVLHRPGQPAVSGSAMYPTPPDGIQNPVGVTPSMDGNLSSPGMITNAPEGTEPTQLQAPTESFSENWENRETKRSSFDTENLFGELGPDMFGDNDITEADFSFFDEQPGGVNLGSLDLPIVPDMEPNAAVRGTLSAMQVQQMKADPSAVPTSSSAPLLTFAKPELRHARSSLLDEARRQLPLDSKQPSNNNNININSKRAASPFNPDTVYKRIRASLDNQKAVQQNSLIYANHHGSIFDKVDFGPGLSMVNRKYEGSGRFDFSADQFKSVKSSNLDTPPTTEYLRRHGKGRKQPKELPSTYGELFHRLCSNQISGSNRPSPQRNEGTQSDADELSLISDQDDSSCDSDEPLSPVKSSLSMRRRRPDDDGDSLATSFRDLDSMDASTPFLPLEFSRSFKSETDLPLARYFADPEPPWIQYSLPDDQFIMAAQLLTDQVTASTLPLTTLNQSSLHSSLDRRRHLSNTARNSIRELQQGLPSCLQLSSGCLFRSLVDIQDVPLLGQPNRFQPRVPGSDQMRPSNLFHIPPPRFEVRRYENKLSVLPSAVSFWESLGLSPTHGSKDINALCLFPDYDGLSDNILIFTDKIRSAYESLRLGSFNRLSSPPVSEDGLFAFEVERDVVSFGKSTSFLGSSLRDCASKVCKLLSTASVEQTTFVLFFVYSPEVPSSIVECCAAFNEIFEGYRKILASKRLPIINEIALQLIPQNLIASTTSVPMPTPADLSRLALEIYDRCSTFGGSSPSPAVILEQPPPRIIDFKVVANPSASVLHENMCLHVAYAQSVDDRWITAAWTDNRGSQQLTSSYCLGRKGKPIATSMTEVIQEIWATTVELISTWKVHWRIIVTKCGAMDAHETELWSSVVTPDTKTSLTLTLVTVDTDPSLQLLPPAVKVPSTATCVFYATPVSTPQGAVVSPEQSGNAATSMRESTAANAATPGDSSSTMDPESDVTLTDVADQTWGAILSHRLHNSTASTDANPALASGYLVKKSSARIEDPPLVMEVNIVHSEGNPRAYEPLLREMLMYYRGLGTLARARGMVDKDNDVRPWHIAAAEKGVRALYMLM